MVGKRFWYIGDDTKVLEKQDTNNRRKHVYYPSYSKKQTNKKYNESRLVDHARFNDETGNENHNDETDNENHNDEIINERRLVEKEIECASLTEKILIVNTQTESNDHPKTSMSTKEREIKPNKRKTKSKSSGRNANKTSDSDENEAIAKEKMICQIDF
ncbi:hypothetical protein TNCV_3257801 [Trichonephila clavipes]|nr:hypothetical protein TNCV_3257801 [Trichonephila clavipes]